ncbi:glycosyltransferase [Umezawaea sp. Da 62-37]|uniref:glycosyltransferase n=1 Tax=Umezawaea sp. Da 62-37 TaxID=3075927 RepID=UPI0028F6F1B8|nr:glycosyltransferase [Umezawaea sp. Da 62-37]WNV88545.1 glycosyltransferase [Umezawaea sp. Da 62-37]
MGLRVLHVISEMGTGGAEALVAGMTMAGRDFGWESAVASGGGHRAEALRVPHFAVPPARRSATGVVRSALATKTAYRRFRPDVVVAHNVGASAVARLAMVPLHRVPVLTVFHGVSATDYAKAAKVLRRTSDSVVAVAAATADRLCEAGLRKPSVIRNAAFPQTPRVDRHTVRAALGVGDDVPVALCLARMEPQKRHDVLLDAWAMLDRDAVLWLAGDGSLRPALERRAHELGLDGRVRFLGNRSDVADLLTATDATVLTSDWEGMPIAVLESLAAGRPVVATDVDGVREALADGGGVVVPRGDPRAVADALRALLSDTDIRAAVAVAGNDHDGQNLMKSYDELLRTMVDGGRR